MHNKFLLGLTVLIIAAAVGCAKHQFLPIVTPPVSTVFTVSSLNHTADTVNVGDTIWLNAAGTIYDTTKLISVYMTSSYTVGGVSSIYDFGTSSSPVKVPNRVIGALNNGVYSWTATIPLTGATEVPVKTKLTIAATFQYQLSFSSELPSNLTVNDAGQHNKTVYVN
jgi:hypothetical protein